VGQFRHDPGHSGTVGKPMYLSLVMFTDGWCGLLSSCPVLEGDNVKIGCYARYEWLSHSLQYDPIGTVNSSKIEFQDEPETLVTTTPLGSAAPETLMTTHTIRDVQAGQTISHTCKVRFEFVRPTLRGYDGRMKQAAHNPLEWTCTVQEPVTCKFFCYLILKILSPLSLFSVVSIVFHIYSGTLDVQKA